MERSRGAMPTKRPRMRGDRGGSACTRSSGWTTSAMSTGTPRVAVNKVRNFLAGQLKDLLAEDASVVEASSMERRDGDEYAFNEPLLENLLGGEGFKRDVILSMLFISPGRHAGPGGDIAEICADAEKAHPGLRTHMSDLFATHPGAVRLLAKRFREGLATDPVTSEVAPPKAAEQG